MDDLFFTQMKLDRKSSERKSDIWVKEHISDRNSVFIPLWKGNYFFSTVDSKICGSKEKSLVEIVNVKTFSQLIRLIHIEHVSSESNKKELSADEYIYFLGTKNTDNEVNKNQQINSAVFVVELSILFPLLDTLLTELSSLLNRTVELLDFRSSIAFIDNEQASFLGYGRALSHWHLSAQFCGFCSAKTMLKEVGHSRQCTSVDCQKVSFPRTDPVVIMLVEYREQGQPNKCLLAGHKRSPDNLLSTIAGFVDPGESLEQAVIREVFEEVGLEVEQVEYIASQPWAFPNSMMIGFYVKAKTNTIKIDPEEISRAHWFTAQDVAEFSDWGEAGDNIQIPRKESISRYLIDHWLKRND